ncbi:MAG: Acyltransferase family protein [Candidatus Accumulibacter sp. BA-94]|nr:MAG: Acyltransferase family protein [Candidatus Accumulibacter sp. BA-94]
MSQDCARLSTNNFDLLRLLFAGTVCLVHAYELSGYRELAWIASVFSSMVAVKAFFIVSGFLIFMSFERSSSMASYARKRLRRIYPAYFAVVMICAIGLVSISSKGMADYFSSAWIKYVAANLSFLNFLQPALPGVFDANRLHAVNGALWTLKIEVMFYLSVPVFVLLFRRFGNLRVIAVACIGSTAYVILFSWLAERTGSGFYLELGRQFPGQLSYFLAGAVFYYHLPFFERWARHLLFGAIIVLVANTQWPLALLEPFALATVVVFFALFPYVGNFGKYGDFSYGVYILHFPILQCLIHFGWLAGRPWLFLYAGAMATLMAAMAMWHLVEKRFLPRNSHYVTACTQAAGMNGPEKQGWVV